LNILKYLIFEIHKVFEKVFEELSIHSKNFYDILKSVSLSSISLLYSDFDFNHYVHIFNFSVWIVLHGWRHCKVNWKRPYKWSNYSLLQTWSFWKLLKYEKCSLCNFANDHIAKLALFTNVWSSTSFLLACFILLAYVPFCHQLSFKINFSRNDLGSLYSCFQNKRSWRWRIDSKISYCQIT